MNLTTKRMLQFMTVGAGACALSATAATTWVGDSFEDADATNNMPIALYRSTVIEESGGARTNIYWTADAGDQSKIVADASSEGYAGSSPMTNVSTQVLNLETEGQTLTRNVFDAETNSLSFQTSSKFVDTLIKFTPSEDTPTIADGTKVAVYVNVNSNLVVVHKYEAPDFEQYTTNTVFVGELISPTNWYRLTIEMGVVQDNLKASRIYLNGTVLTHANAITNASTAKDWFRNIQTGATLSAVAFQGTGMVDELVVSSEVNFGSGAGILLTLSFNSSMVSVLTNGAAAAPDAQVATETAVVISAKPWYELTNGGELLINATSNTVSGSYMVTNIAGTVSSGSTATNTIVAVAYTDPGSISTGLGGSYPANLVAAWAIDPAKGNGVWPVTPDMLDEYLLNAATNSNPKLAITGIVYDSANTKAVVTLSVTNAPGVVDFQDINGTLSVWTTEDLATPFALAGAFSITTTNVADVVIDVPTASGNFIKAKVQ